MPCLFFDEVDNEARFSTLSAALQDLAIGAWTVAIVSSRTAVTNAWDALWTLGANDLLIANLHLSTEWQSNTLFTVSDDSFNSNGTHGLTLANDAPYLCVTTKASGTNAPVTYIKRLDTGAATGSITHGTTIPNKADTLTAGGKLAIGSWLNSSPDWMGGRISVFAAWTGVNMTLAEMQACGTNQRTSDLWNHSRGNPTCLIELTSTTPTDLAGGVGSILLMTATADAANLNWTYDGTGAPAAAIPFRPHRMPMGV